MISGEPLALHAAQVTLNDDGLAEAARSIGLRDHRMLTAFLGMEIREPITSRMIAAVLRGLPVTFDMIFTVT